MARAKEDALDEESPSSAEAMEGETRVYELGFHLDPNLPTEGVKEAYQNIRTRISDNATIVAEGDPQKVPLAYTISRNETGGRSDFDSAYFSWIVYEVGAGSHAEIITNVGADKNVIRFIDVLTDKDTARHALEMRELSLKMPERTPDSEEVLGAEIDAALEHAAV